MCLPREFDENIKQLTVNRIGLISTLAWLNDSTAKITVLQSCLVPEKMTISVNHKNAWSCKCLNLFNFFFFTISKELFET
jgi:hypothetical protein